jgi:hypothetical protein
MRSKIISDTSSCSISFKRLGSILKVKKNNNNRQMKNYIRLALLAILVFKANFLRSQDFIYKTDGSKIECIVESLDSNVITYSNSKSTKQQTININQAAVVVFGNGQYITLPSSELKFENAKSANGIINDIIIDKFAEIKVGTIRNLSKTEIEFNDAQTNDLSRISGDEAVLAIYKGGDHVFFRNASDVKALLEYVQPKVFAQANKQSNPSTPSEAPVSQPVGRPAYLGSSNGGSIPSTVGSNASNAGSNPLNGVSNSSNAVSSSSNVVSNASNVGSSPSNVNANTSNGGLNASIVAEPKMSSAEVKPVEKTVQSEPSKNSGSLGYKSNLSQLSNPKTNSSENTAGKSNPNETAGVNSNSREVTETTVVGRNLGNSSTLPNAANTGSPVNSSSSETSTSPDELTDINFEEFSDKALQKIDDFTNYLGIIASKETVPESANQAIELAMELFVDENVLVEVSTSGYAEVMKRKIKDYLVRLKLLKYDRVEIQWADINYVSNFRKGPDGNYYGSITVKQTFRGYKDNQVVYSDVTQKDVEIVIKGMEKSIQGKKEMVWDVLLSDIGVLDTK